MRYFKSFLLLVVAIAFSCGDSKEEATKPVSPRVKKSTKIISPNQNQTFERGSIIPFSFTADGDNIDSVQVIIENETQSFSTSSFEVALPSQRVGTWSLRTKVFCQDVAETHIRKIIIYPENPPLEMTYSIINTYPHDTDDYTQGLLIKDGFLYESTGQKGLSTFKKKKLTTGETLQVVNLDDNLFGEGLALYNDEFYQLTWTSGKGIVYNLDMEEVRTFSYPMQGWGLTTYKDQLILTDESEKLYFIEPSSFTVMSVLEVYDDEGKVDSLNELELIDGKIWANVYYKDDIVVIDPETGEVLQRIDFSGLLTEKEKIGTNVLNGIAVDPATGKIYVTGKDWPKLFEVTIQPKTL